MKPGAANFLKVLYVMFALPFNMVALARSKDMRYLISIAIVFAFITLWLWQWHRRLVYRTEFLHLASKLPQLAGKEKEEAHRRLLELAKPNIIPVHEIAVAFYEMNRLEAKIRENKQEELARGLEILRRYTEEDNDDAIEL